MVALQDGTENRADQFQDAQDVFSQLIEILDSFFELHWRNPKRRAKVPKSILTCVRIVRQPILQEKLLLTLTSMRSFTSEEVPDLNAFKTLDLLDILSHIRAQMESMLGVSIYTSNIEKFYGNSPFKCPRLYCDFFHEGFSTIEQRQDHVTKHERCHYCPYSGCTYAKIGCATAKDLEAHISRYHNAAAKDTDFPPDAEKPLTVQNGKFRCPECNKPFTRAFNLKSHLRTHTDEGPYGCSTCSKNFARQHDRKVHEQQHAKVKKTITCQGKLEKGGIWGCGKTFPGAHALVRHFGTQTGRYCIKTQQSGAMMGRENNRKTSTIACPL